MAHSDLRRLARDVETIQQAAGLELPFGKADVYVNLALIPAGALMAVWGAMTGPRLMLVGLLPLALALLPGAYLRYQYRRSTGRSPGRRREYSFNFVLGGVLLAGASGFAWWAGHHHFSSMAVAIAAVFFTGLFVTALGLLDRMRRYQLGPGLPLIAFGLALPLLEPYKAANYHATMIAGGVTVALAGLLTAAIMHAQLNAAARNEVIRDAAAA
jgi:hypothetical protein